MEGAGLRIGLFGRLTAARGDTEVPVRGTRRALLARLALSPGQIVPSSVLCDDLWPHGAASAPTLAAQVFRLRRDLGHDRDTVVQRDGGYLLNLDRRAIDLWGAIDSLALGEAEGEAFLHRLHSLVSGEAGAPLEEFGDYPWAIDEAHRVEAVLLRGYERRIDAHLRQGRADLVVGLLEDVCARHPFREDLWASLMLAYHRLGRQRDALDTARRLRLVLREELGLSPGPAVADLERMMLARDPRLDVTAPVLADSGAVIALVVRDTARHQRETAVSTFRQVAGGYDAELQDAAYALPPPLIVAAAAMRDITRAANLALDVLRLLKNSDVGVSVVGAGAGVQFAVALAASTDGVALDRSAADELGTAMAVSDVGPHRLVDLGPPRAVFTLDGANVRGLVDSNLPVEVTSMVGRSEDVRRLHEVIRSGGIVTLLGPGGIGKTRLALQAAAPYVLVRPGGVWFVDLGDCAKDSVPAAVGAAIGLESGDHRLDAVIERLRSMPPSLVVLDCCEGVVANVASMVDRLVAEVPELALLATSREPLRARAERVFHVEPLDLPETATLADARSSAAVALFVDRAQAARVGFRLTSATVGPVVEVCRRLDGIPLAVELAALTLVDSDLDAVASGVGRAEGPRGIAERQRTLASSLAWGHAHLAPADRELLEALSVFAGLFTAADVEAIWPGAAVERLTERGLVRRDGDGLRLLDVVREFAAEQLRDSPDGDLMRDRHLERMVSWTTSTVAAGGWRDVGRREADCLAAMARAEEVNDPERGAEIALALHRWWVARGDRSSAEHLRAFADHPAIPPQTAARLWGSHGQLALDFGHFDVAIESCERALEYAVSSLQRGRVLVSLSAALASAGSVDEARPLMEEAAGLLRDEPSAAGAFGTLLCNLAILAHDQGDLDTAERWYDDALDVQREARDLIALGRTCANAGTLYDERGEFEAASRLYLEGLAAAEAVGDNVAACMLQANLANTAASQGDVDGAWQHGRAAVGLAPSAGDLLDQVLTLVAGIAVQRGDPESAVRLLRCASTEPAPEIRASIRAELGDAADDLWAEPPLKVADLLARLP